MTIGIACRFQDGVLFCADTKITTNQEKSNESKISVRQWGADKNGVSVFALAGAVPYARAAIERCERTLGALNFGHTTLDEIQTVIEGALVEFYQMHMFPNPDRSTPEVAFDLLIGIWLNGSSRILASTGTVLQTVDSYECIGAGGYLARYLLRQALGTQANCNPDELTLSEASLIIEHAINSIVQFDEACGYGYQDDAEYVMMRHSGEIGDLRGHVYPGSNFAYEMQSLSWGLVLGLTKVETQEDAEAEIDEFHWTIRSLIPKKD